MTDIVVEQLSNRFTDVLQRAENAMMMHLAGDSWMKWIMMDVENDEG